MIGLEAFRNLEWSFSKAYIIGLMLPRLDVVILDDEENYMIAGTVAHQSKSIGDELLNEHIFKMSSQFNQDNLGAYFTIKYSKVIKYIGKKGPRISGKKGFAVFLDTNIKKSNVEFDDKHRLLLNQYLVDLAENIPDEFIDAFIAGTIDGRSSLDIKSNLVAIDIDRDPIKYKALIEIISKSSIDARINSRKNRTDEKKSDQLRYQKNSLSDISKLRLFSKKRFNDIAKAVQELK